MAVVKEHEGGGYGCGRLHSRITYTPPDIIMHERSRSGRQNPSPLSAFKCLRNRCGYADSLSIHGHDDS